METKKEELIEILKDKRSDSELVYLLVGADQHIKTDKTVLCDLVFTPNLEQDHLFPPTLERKKIGYTEQGYELINEELEQQFLRGKKGKEILNKEKLFTGLSKKPIQVVVSSYTYEDIHQLIKRRCVQRSTVIKPLEVYSIKHKKVKGVFPKITIQPRFDYFEVFMDEMDGVPYSDYQDVSNKPLGRCSFLTISPSITNKNLHFSRYLVWDSKEETLSLHNDFITIKGKSKDMKNSSRLKLYIDYLFNNINKPITYDELYKEKIDTEETSIVKSVHSLRKIMKENLEMSDKKTFSTLSNIEGQKTIMLK